MADEEALAMESEKPTPCLRFLRRDDKTILQQLWQVIHEGSHVYEWRVVPTVNLDGDLLGDIS